MSIRLAPEEVEAEVGREVWGGVGVLIGARNIWEAIQRLYINLTTGLSIASIARAFFK